MHEIVMSKMNSCDLRYRDERDIPLLLELADKATLGWHRCADVDHEIDDALAAMQQFIDLRDRRLAEDAGGVVK
jgi:hypothetical protein